MGNVKRIYVEKKDSFAVKARELEEDIKGYLGISGLEKVRIFIRYDVENLSSAEGNYVKSILNMFEEESFSKYRKIMIEKNMSSWMGERV